MNFDIMISSFSILKLCFHFSYNIKGIMLNRIGDVDILINFLTKEKSGQYFTT